MDRVEVWISHGYLDAQDIAFDKLPVGIVRCWSCRGNGKVKQWYCDAPSMTGACSWCKATGFKHEDTSEAVSPSVVNQIAVAHDLTLRHTMYGNDWSKP
jgi:hypothetical protein